MTNIPEPKGKINLPAYLDNKSPYKTILVLEDGTQIEIDPFEIFKDMIDNNNPDIVQYTNSPSDVRIEFFIDGHDEEHILEIDLHK